MMDWMSVWKYFTMGIYGVAVIMVIYSCLEMIYSKRDPVRTVTWIIVLILIPYFGLVLYLVFGQNFRKKKIYSRKGVRDEKIRISICREQEYLYKTSPESIPSDLTEYKTYKKMILQNLRSSHSILAQNSDVRIYFSGKDAIDAMVESMKSARMHIHLQSYIIADDTVGNIVKDILVKKAREGLVVRVIYDDVGSWTIGKAYVRELREAGVEVSCFSPVSIVLPKSKINYRNHRKILVVDGSEAFIGGVNIADRYCTGGSFREWRDTHIRFRGESVFSIQACFLLDRYFILNKQILRKRRNYYPEIKALKKVDESSSNVYAQIITSGPDSDWASIMQTYFTAITCASESVKIITPYFTPGETLLNAIKIAALGGIRVEIMMPEKSDSKITQWSTFSYISELLDAGVKVYLFSSGFNHSKVISVDGKICIVGSANMDNRSMEYNFEITSILYNRNLALQIENQFEEDKKRCVAVDISVWKQRPAYVRTYESLARLLSPLL